MPLAVGEEFGNADLAEILDALLQLLLHHLPLLLLWIVGQGSAVLFGGHWTGKGLQGQGGGPGRTGGGYGRGAHRRVDRKSGTRFGRWCGGIKNGRRRERKVGAVRR